jgi:multiple sugar transport system permease protein
MKGGRPRVMGGKAYARRSKYVMFIVPATIITIAVILFPWVFTLWMSLNDWTIGSSQIFVGLDNFTKLATDQRFLSSIPRTMYYTVLAVVLPVIFGTLAAVVFNQHFPLRGLLRGIFIMPMMATPVAIALVWTMMFHPQLGVLNYMLSLVGIPEQMWVYSQDTVIPALVMVEIWNWTPLIMVIMLGGLAVLPIEPYESAVIDGANPWNIFWHITFPLVLPFLMVAVILRTIDALKAFDTIFVITQGGPGTASETINILLYLQAFAYYKIGSASAMVVVFFIIIVLLSLVMLYVRQKTLWTE